MNEDMVLSATPKSAGNVGEFAKRCSTAASLAAALCLVPACMAAPQPANAASATEDLVAAPASTQGAPVLERIRRSGQIVLAHREASVPFSYLDADQHPIGYALDICRDLAEVVRRRLGLKTLTVSYLPVTVATRIPAIVEGKADLDCGTTTNNAERRKSVAFTVPHYITGTRYLVRADSSVTDLNEFAGRVLVTISGSTQFKVIDKVNREHLMHISLRQVPDNASALKLVDCREADGFALDDVQLYGLISGAANRDTYKVVGKFLTIEPLAIMISRDDAGFKKLIDDEMKRIIRSGEAQYLYNKWFLQPIPPKNVSVNLPMNYFLRDFWRYPSDQIGD